MPEQLDVLTLLEKRGQVALLSLSSTPRVGRDGFIAEANYTMSARFLYLGNEKRKVNKRRQLVSRVKRDEPDGRVDGPVVIPLKLHIAAGKISHIESPLCPGKRIVLKNPRLATKVLNFTRDNGTINGSCKGNVKGRLRSIQYGTTVLQVPR